MPTISATALSAAVLSAASFGLSALPAAATPYVATYEGVITDASIGSTLFGGVDIVGQQITAIYNYDTANGLRTTDLGVSDDLAGGINFSTASTITSAVFKVGSSVFSFSPDYYSDIYASPGFLDAYGYNFSTNNYGFQTYIVPTAAAPSSVAETFSSPGEGDGGGRYSQYSYVSNGVDTVDFDAQRVAITSPAPEPGIWALMLLGVGLSGWRLRRKAGRRRSAIGLAMPRQLASG